MGGRWPRAKNPLPQAAASVRSPRHRFGAFLASETRFNPVTSLICFQPDDVREVVDDWPGRVAPGAGIASRGPGVGPAMVVDGIQL